MNGIMYSMDTYHDMGNLGREMLSSGIFWFSLGSVHGNTLSININDISSMFIICSPASYHQLRMVESLYEYQTRHLPRHFIMDRDMSPRECRHMIHAAAQFHANEESMVLIEGINRLYDGVRSYSGTHNVDDDISSIMNNTHMKIIITDDFHDSSTRIGRISHNSDFVMTIGAMTPLYSQLAFGHSLSNYKKDVWSAIAMTSNEMIYSFRLKNHMVPLTKGLQWEEQEE